MYHKSKQFLLRPLSPVWILVCGLTLVALLTSLAGVMNYQYEAKNLPAPNMPIAKVAKPNVQNEQTVEVIESKTKETSVTSKRAAVSASVNSTSKTPDVNNAQHETQVTQSQDVKVSLSVNGQYSGDVYMKVSESHCAVLSTAFRVGIITSLDMRYSTQYKTHAVYMINGIGDSNSIWWTYTVNGRSPPYGCDGMRVQSGDSVNWQYVKQ